MTVQADYLEEFRGLIECLCTKKTLLPQRKRIVFLLRNITDDGTYIAYLNAYLGLAERIILEAWKTGKSGIVHYANEAITGTQVTKRVNFQRMITKID